jgi:hypothetical protein
MNKKNVNLTYNDVTELYRITLGEGQLSVSIDHLQAYEVRDILKKLQNTFDLIHREIA